MLQKLEERGRRGKSKRNVTEEDWLGKCNFTRFENKGGLESRNCGNFEASKRKGNGSHLEPPERKVALLTP